MNLNKLSKTENKLASSPIFYVKRQLIIIHEPFAWLLIAALLLILPNITTAADTKWQGNFSNNWLESGVVTPSPFLNWDNGVPTDAIETTTIDASVNGSRREPIEISRGRAFGGTTLRILGRTINLLNDGNLTGNIENVSTIPNDNALETSSFNQFVGTVHTIENTLTIDNFSTYNLSGGQLNAANITNNGTFVQSGGSISGFGAGRLTFSNNGAFSFAAGTLNGNLINTGTVNFDPKVNRAPSTETFGGNISGVGSLTKAGVGTLILTGQNSNTGNWTVSGGVLQGNSDSLKSNINNSAIVVFDQNINGSYNGVMSGTGKLIKQNNGLLILNNKSTYTGGTQVSAGNLQIGDATHPTASIQGQVDIDPAGILSGHGAVNGNVNNSGTLSPGGSIGNLTVNGNVTFNPGSTFNVEISPTQASQLIVNGQATLGNANVSVLADPGTYSPQTYTILTATNPISGNFGKLNLTSATPNPSLIALTPSLQYLPNQVNLSLERLNDPNPPVVAPPYKLIGGRLQTPLGEYCPENRFGFWARGIGMLSSADASGFAPRYNSDTAGTVVGFDKQFGEHLTLGIAGVYAHTDATTFQQFNNNHSSADSLGLSIYGALTLGAWQYRGIIGYDNDAYTAQRTVAISRIPRLAQSKSHANSVSSYNEISYSFKSHDFTLQPLVALNLGWLHRKGYTETGLNTDGQNLSVNGRTLYSLDTLVGLRARQEFEFNDKLKAQFEIRALYDHDFGTRQDSVGGRFAANGQNVLLSTSDRSDQRDAGIFGASIALLNANSLNIYLDYNGEIRSGQQSHFISAGVRYYW